MEYIKKIFKQVFSSKIFILGLCGFALLGFNEVHIYDYWSNEFTRSIDHIELPLHLGVAFFIAIILELVNERAVREKIAGSAKESMKETLSQVVKVLTKSDEVGKALDFFIEKCKDFYRNNSEIELKISKMSEGLFLIEIDSRYDIVNQTSAEKHYRFRYGGDSPTNSLSGLYIDGVKVDSLPGKKPSEMHGIVGYLYEKEIPIPKNSSVQVRFVCSVEADNKNNYLYSNTFVTPALVKSLKIVLDKDSGIKAEQVKVLTRGTPNAVKKFDLEYTFDCCFLPYQSFYINVTD